MGTVLEARFLASASESLGRDALQSSAKMIVTMVAAYMRERFP